MANFFVPWAVLFNSNDWVTLELELDGILSDVAWCHVNCTCFKTATWKSNSVKSESTDRRKKYH